MLLQDRQTVPNLAGVLPLSLNQEGIWFFEQANPGTATYNLYDAWWLEGPLDIGALQRSLNELVKRHETLRTAIANKNGDPCQIVFPPKPFPLAVTDLRDHLDPDAEAESLATLDARTPFDLTLEPLVRCNLFRTGDERALLSLSMHHIISDAWSVGVFMRELARGYHSETPMPDLPIQYGDYAIWQREASRTDSFRRDLDFWQRQLRGANPRLDLPADFARPSAQTYQGASVAVACPASITTGLKEQARVEGSTTCRILLAAFGMLLQRYTLQDDLLIGSPFAGRDELETEDLIGFFVNTHALRLDLAGDPAFRQLLQRINEVSMSANLHQRAPLQHLVRTLKLDRNLSSQVLFQAAFVWQTDFADDWSLPGINASRIDLDNRTSKFDLTAFAIESDSELRLRFEYNTDLFTTATAERWARQFLVLVGNIIKEPSRRISEIQMETDEEKHKTLAWSAGPETAYERDSCVHEIFELQAARNPSGVALALGDEEMSYGELNHWANVLAARLAQAGVCNGAVVGICLERSMQMIVGLLGILKAGAAFLPLDPANPRARNATLIEDAQAGFVLTRNELRGVIPAKSNQILCIDSPDWPRDGERMEQSEAQRPKAADVAYIMYTSGSTGRPKGVAVTHRAIARLVRNSDYVQFSPRDIFLQLAPISFDASTFEIWGALLNGGKLVIHPPHFPSLEELGRVLRREKVTILWLTSGWFNQMVDNQLESLGRLRVFLTGGEALSVPHVVAAASELKKCQLINGYGPTETTTFACCYRVPHEWRGGVSVPIGRPIANTQAYILDAAQKPVAEGVAGELYIGGDGVARGYVNRPELTGAKFVANPFGPGRLYRTGDLARWLADGNIEFLGRHDEQVKIRGFRVEPGEIEAALKNHASVREAVVVARAYSSGTSQLEAFIVPQSDATTTNTQLREYLMVQLPSFMVPSQLRFLEKLPLTPNGKVDRRALLALEKVQSSSSESPVLPRNPTESSLVGIWREVLQQDSISVFDNFFHLGGHSLLATRIISRVARTFGVELPVRIIFETPTIAGMAQSVNKHKGVASAGGIPRTIAPSRAQKLLEKIDELSENDVEELLLQLDEEELRK